MRTSIVTLLAVLCVGIAARCGYRFAADALTWRTNKAVQLSVLAQAEQHRKMAQIFRDLPAEDGSDKLAAIIVARMNQTAEDEVIDAKNALLRLYQYKDLPLSAEEAAQVSRWQQDVAAWEAVNMRR